MTVPGTVMLRRMVVNVVILGLRVPLLS